MTPGDEVDVVVLVLVDRHLDATDDDEHGQDDQPDEHIRPDEHLQVGIADSLELCLSQLGALGGVHGVQAVLDEVHGHVHAQQRAHGVEGLRQVQAPRGRFLAAHGEDVGVAARLQEGQAARQDEVGDEEGEVHPRQHRGIEQESPEGVQPQPQHDARLVRVLADEDGGRIGHGEVAPVEGHLHQCALGDAHAENLRERLHHGVGDVVGEAPQGETRGNQDEGHHITDVAFMQDG